MNSMNSMNSMKTNTLTRLLSTLAFLPLAACTACAGQVQPAVRPATAAPDNCMTFDPPAAVGCIVPIKGMEDLAYGLIVKMCVEHESHIWTMVGRDGSIIHADDKACHFFQLQQLGQARQ